MKTFVKLSGLLLVSLGACTTGYQSAAVHDDIYYSQSTAQKLAEEAPQANVQSVQIQAQDESRPAAAYTDNYAEEKQQYQQDYQDYENQEDTLYYEEEDSQVTYNNFYLENYYHDYYYSSRIRRFHHHHPSFGYYDPFYTNMYWYNYDPHYFGMSIYMGYDPFFSPGYYSWGYRPWGGAHYGYAWGYGSLYGGWGGNYYGYGGGYHHGYYDYGYGYRSPYYYDDVQQYVYTARRPSESTYGFGTREPGRYVAGTQNKSGLDQSIRSGRFETPGGRTARTPGNNVNGAVAGGRRGAVTEPSETPRISKVPVNQAREGSATQRPYSAREGEGENKPAKYQPRRTPQDYSNPQRAQAGEKTPRYERPQQHQRPQRSGGTQVDPNYTRPRTYTSPSQQQPRSSQEYRRPSNEQRPPARGNQVERAAPQRQTPQQGTQAAPQRVPQQRPQATPQRTVPQQRPQATPQRSTPQQRPQATPQRSVPQQRPQAAPQRTAPRRSTPTYSAPSRNTGRSSSPSTIRSTSPSRSSGSSAPSRSGSSSSSSSGSSSSPSRRR